jgi:predicted N-acyltransferase
VSTAVSSSCSGQPKCESLKDFSINIYDTITQVPEADWNRHVPAHGRLMYHDQLAMIEESQAGKMEFRYAFIKKDDVTTGIAYFQLVHFTADDLRNYFPEEPKEGVQKYVFRFLKTLSAPLLNWVDLKLLVSGNIFMTGENGFFFNPDIDKAQRGALLRKAITETAATDKRIRAVLISDMYEPHTEFDEDFKKAGFYEITVESDMSIRLNESWKTFDDYIMALSSKYRVRAKKVLSLCKENEVVKMELNAEEIKQHESELFALYMKVMDKAEFKLALLNKDFFCRQKQLLPDNYHLLAYFKNNELLAFISYYQIGKRMEVHYTGMDHEVCKPIHMYQNMLYNMIECGIQNGAERLHFGRTAPEIKSTIGARPSEMYGYVKHFNKLFNRIAVATFTARLKPKEYIIRNPFK